MRTVRRQKVALAFVPIAEDCVLVRLVSLPSDCLGERSNSVPHSG